MKHAYHEKLNSPINAPRMQTDRDKQAKAALAKGGGKLGPRQAKIAAADEKAEKASYKLNRKRF